MIVKTPWAVLKFGSRTIGAQGEWMQNHWLPHCVKVYAVGQSWYLMEPLEEREFVFPFHKLYEMLDSIWFIEGDENERWKEFLERKLAGNRSMLLSFSKEAFHALGDYKPCLTHGDPTRENFMYSPIEQRWKFIDPLLPRPYLPAHPIQDMAKIGQSIMGWEFYTRRWPMPNAYVKERFLQQADTRGPAFEYLWFWTALCFERIQWRNRPGSKKYETAKILKHMLLDRGNEAFLERTYGSQKQ